MPLSIWASMALVKSASTVSTASGLTRAAGSRSRGSPAGVEHPADELQGEALGVELLDPLDPVDDVGWVVADPTSHLGRREEAEGLPLAEVADGHPDALGKAGDGERRVGRRRLSV